jgi:hypothetical protein
MNEHEKTLRAEVARLALALPEAAKRIGKLCDEVIAEHRAEVELLRQERDAENRRAGAARNDVRQCHAALDTAGVVHERSGEPGVTRPLLERIAILADERNTARDAALEEAGQVLGNIKGNIGGRNAANVILSLRSAPVQVVPVAKVREVLVELRRYGHEREMEAIRDQQMPLGGRMVAWTAEKAAERLGVDLDATGGECGGNADCGGHRGGLCPACAARQPRETASEENGLLPRRPVCTRHPLCVQSPGHEGTCGDEDAHESPHRVVLCGKDPKCNQFVGHPGPCNTRKAEAWILHVFNRAGALWDRISGTEAELRNQGAGFTTAKGQKAWRCALSKNGVPVAECKRGVWRDVSDAAGSVKP